MGIECRVETVSASHWQFADPDPDKTAPGNRRSPECDRNSGRQPKIARSGRILVVDDDEAVRETLADLLEIAGYCPLQAADALEALMILRQDAAVDALVTDLTMPGADGIMLIRHAREIRHDLPAILLTGYAEQVASVSTIAGGRFHVLSKPVQSDRLIEQLELLVKKPPDA
jgi:CheY-like chemotaxis protein